MLLEYQVIHFSKGLSLTLGCGKELLREFQTLPLFLSLIYKRSHDILVNIATETTVKHFQWLLQHGQCKSRQKQNKNTDQQVKTTTKTDEIGNM